MGLGGIGLRRGSNWSLANALKPEGLPVGSMLVANGRRNPMRRGHMGYEKRQTAVTNRAYQSVKPGHPRNCTYLRHSSNQEAPGDLTRVKTRETISEAQKTCDA